MYCANALNNQSATIRACFPSGIGVHQYNNTKIFEVVLNDFSKLNITIFSN